MLDHPLHVLAHPLDAPQAPLPPWADSSRRATGKSGKYPADHTFRLNSVKTASGLTTLFLRSSNRGDPSNSYKSSSQNALRGIPPLRQPPS